MGRCVGQRRQHPPFIAAKCCCRFQLHDRCAIQTVKPRLVRMQYEVVANCTANALQAPSKTSAGSHAVKENVPVQIILRKSHQLPPAAYRIQFVTA